MSGATAVLVSPENRDQTIETSTQLKFKVNNAVVRLLV